MTIIIMLLPCPRRLNWSWSGRGFQETQLLTRADRISLPTVAGKIDPLSILCPRVIEELTQIIIRVGSGGGSVRSPPPPSIAEEDRLRVKLVSSGLDPDGLNFLGLFAAGQRSADHYWAPTKIFGTSAVWNFIAPRPSDNSARVVPGVSN